MSQRIALAFVAVIFLSAGLLFVRPPQARAVYTISPILLIHGWNTNSALDCNGTWGTVRDYLSSHGMTTVRTLGFYLGDSHCDQYVLDNGNCSNWYNGNFGTVNEDIRHTTCNIAWWIWNNYTQYGTTVGVIAHSMGGILIRHILNDTAWVHPTFPPYLKIWDVATAGSPHQGLASATAGAAALGSYIGVGGCWSPCLELGQMEKYNPLMSNMNSQIWRNGTARNPQGDGGTDWTTITSAYDDLFTYACLNTNERMGVPSPVGQLSACGLMPGAKHFVHYPGPGFAPYYNHGDYLVDTNTAWDADECYSDNTGGVWSCVYNSEHSSFTMHYAMLYSTW